MTAGAGGARRPAPRVVILASVAAGVVLVWWLMTHAFISASARECHRRYSAARTAADTAAVDAHVPDSNATTSAASASCGGMRENARW